MSLTHEIANARAIIGRLQRIMDKGAEYSTESLQSDYDGLVELSQQVTKLGACVSEKIDSRRPADLVKDEEPAKSKKNSKTEPK